MIPIHPVIVGPSPSSLRSATSPIGRGKGVRPASFTGGEAFGAGFGVMGVMGNDSVLSGAEQHLGRSLHTLTNVAE